MITNLKAALTAPNPSTRLQAALAAGTRPDPVWAAPLVELCAVEPDFFVRDMLTWALTRMPVDVTVPLLHAQLTDPRPQARSQALHTLSKIRDTSVWPALTPALLHDPDPEVTRSAWRAAVALVPYDQRPWLARELVAELGRGDIGMRRSLSRALAALAGAATEVLEERLAHPDPEVAAHARATMRLLADPDADLAADLAEARRVASLGPGHED